MYYPKLDISILQSTLKTIVLFDALGHSIKKKDLVHFLYEQTALIEDVEISLSTLEDLGLISRVGNEYFLFAREKEVVTSFIRKPSLTFWQENILKILASFQEIRGIYYLPEILGHSCFVLDFSGFNDQHKTERICKMAQVLLGQKVLFIDRFNVSKHSNTLNTLAIASLVPLYNLTALEKLNLRVNKSLATFNNRSTPNQTPIDPFLSLGKPTRKKTVGVTTLNSRFEFFNRIDHQIYEFGWDEKWKQNRQIYNQWLRPRLTKMGRKNQLI